MQVLDHSLFGRSFAGFTKARPMSTALNHERSDGTWEQQNVRREEAAGSWR
jgi:hypothetical protein